MTPEQKDNQLRKFFEWYSEIKAIAERQGFEVKDVLNVRQIFDIAYAYGYTASLQDRVDEVQTLPVKLFDEDGNEIAEFYCDPCSDENCNCRVQRCDYCKAND